MRSDKKIIVITDNLELLKSFNDIVVKLKIPDFFDYYSSSSETSTIKSISVKTEIEKILQYDILISLHCKQIIPKEIFTKIRCINIHPGFNPFNRGWYPQTFCILNGKKYGATIHEINETIDGGAIIDQIETIIEKEYTSKEAYELNRIQELKLIEKNLSKIISGTYKSKKLRILGNYNSRLDFENLLEIDLDKTVTMREAIDYLRSVSFEGFKNAFYYNNKGEKIFIEVKLSK
jgi:methionyl-tRNA formyltransferase